MTFGFSRDDAGKFIPEYERLEVFKYDVFASVDQEGAAAGKKANPNLSVGICGEHGGDPESVKFFHNAGVDYVSCSPFRIPVALVAAAQAAIESK